jgi:hypothetical protein
MISYALLRRHRGAKTSDEGNSSVAVAAFFPLIAASPGFVDRRRAAYLYTSRRSRVFRLRRPHVTGDGPPGARLLSALTIFGLVRINDSPSFAERADGMHVPAHLGPLIAELDRLHVDRVYAEYWDAYRIDFETDERIVAAESPQEVYARRGDKVVVLDNDHVRYRPYVDEVTRSPRPAHVVQAGSADEANLDVPLLRAAGYRRATAPGYVIWYLPR